MNGSGLLYWADEEEEADVYVGRRAQVMGNGGNTGVTAEQVGVAGSEMSAE